MDSFGEFLRRERELRHVELGEIAKTTKIKKTYLQAIETDLYDDLPDIAFVKGFIRAYCNYIGLDPEKTVNYFQQCYDEKYRQAPEPHQKKVYNRENRKKIVFTAVLALSAAGIVALAIFYWTTGPAGRRLSGTRVRHPVTAEPVTAQSVTLPASVFTPSAVLAVTPAAAFTRTAEEHTMLLKATEDTWVRLVNNNDENTAREALLKSGDTVSWKFTGTAMLTVGNAEGLDIVLDHKQVPHRKLQSEVIRLKLPH